MDECDLFLRFDYDLHRVFCSGDYLKTFGCLLERQTVSNHVLDIDGPGPDELEGEP